MLSPPLENQTAIPSATTSFLCPCNEDAVQEHLPSTTSKTKKKEFLRSYSCDVILPKKPHPFRSPMTYLRSTTLPRNYNSKRHENIQQNDLHQYTLRFDGESEWSLDEEYPVCTSQSKTATTNNTPFCGLSNQPYYARRQSASLGKLNKKKEKEKGSKSTSHVLYQQQSFDGHYATMRPQKKDKSEGCEGDSESLRRRASSLDFLPETISKNCSQQNGGKPVPFGRTTSLSQRSPFRKKISHTAADQETLQGIKDYRPKGTKRLRSGLDALFESIEKHDIEELRKILGTLDVNINELNADQFTPLDVALMCGETEIASILLEHGGRENPNFVEAKDREEHLKKLIDIADGKVNDCNTSSPNSAGEAKDNDKQLREWEWKLLMLRIMYNKFLIMDCPKHIPALTIAPLSNDSVVLTITPATEEFDVKNMVTKYKVDWSQSEDFSDIKDSKLLPDTRQISCTISSLEKGVGWYFRVQSGNLKGFSPYGYPDPRVVHPSSWHECDLSLPRYYSTSEKLDQLVDQLLAFQKEMAEKTNDEENGEDESSVSPRQPPDINDSPRHRHKKMAKGFSKYTNLIFNSAPKLLKKIKRRGIYLAALLYSEDYTNVLVTMDENLPVVECDENYSKTLTQEIYWFSKASCTWKDINHMLYFSTKSHSSHSVQIRRKLLQSALALMNATGVHDLGPIHYKPFKDNNGSILLLAVNCIKKHLSGSRSMAMKWIPITKLLKKTNSTNDQVMAPERLIPSVEDQVTCHRRSRTKLPRGLYLGYLKLRTSVDVLSIMVPNSHTNVLPFIKIQDIPNVTKEEWTWLKSSNTVTGQISTDETCQSVRTFEKRLKKALSSLFVQLNIDKETLMSHRIYDKEVIELSSEVLFLLVCPPCDDMCTPPNQPDGFTHLPDYSALPFQAFEMSNMMTYQPNIMSAYCRLSSILELENYCMQQVVRQTICHKQLNHLKERQSRLADFQQSVDELWRSSRWVFDTIQTCQDKNLNSGIRVASLYRTSGAGDWGECNGSEGGLDVRCSLSSNGTTTTHSQSTDFSGDVEVSFDCSFNSIKSDHVSLNSSKSDHVSLDSSKSDHVSCNSSKSDHASNNCSKSDHVLVIHGSKELGLDEMCCVEVQTNDRTTTCDLIKMATDQFSDETSKNDTCEGSSTDGGGGGGSGASGGSGCGSASGGSDSGGELSDVRFCKQLLQQLCLVVVTGGDEICLDDSNLVRRPWSSGTTYLRLKKDTTNQQQPVGVGTTV